MRGSVLQRVVVVTAIVMVVSFAIAGIIGVRAGLFREMAGGKPPASRKGGSRTVTVQAPAGGFMRVSVIDSVSERVIIREGAGAVITGKYFEPDNTVAPVGEPLFKGSYQNGVAEIRLEWKHQCSPPGWRNAGSRLEVELPKGYGKALSVKTISADTRLPDQPFTDVAISTVSGDLQAGAVRAQHFSSHATSGDIAVGSLQSGQGKITVVSGDVDIKQMTGDADIHSTSGDVAIAFAKAPRKVTAESVSGEITLTLAQGTDVTLDAHAVSGDVRLMLPPDAGFTLNARSVSGDIGCDFPITLSGAHTGGGKPRIAGTVGNGKGSVSAQTVSGDINIMRGTALSE